VVRTVAGRFRLGGNGADRFVEHDGGPKSDPWTELRMDAQVAGGEPRQPGQMGQSLDGDSAWRRFVGEPDVDHTSDIGGGIDHDSFDEPVDRIGDVGGRGENEPFDVRPQSGRVADHHHRGVGRAGEVVGGVYRRVVRRHRRAGGQVDPVPGQAARHQVGGGAHTSSSSNSMRLPNGSST
jgi:hypothetical protein